MSSALVLFAGAAGSTLGIEQAGYETVGVDNWAPAIATHEANLLKVVQADLIGEPVDWLTDYAGIDLLWASPPCQPFSQSRTQAGEWDTRDGFPATLRAIELLRPPNVVIENVPGLAQKKNAYYLDAVLSRIADLGYEVEARLLNAADYGVPQNRKRLIIVAMLGERPCWPDRTSEPVSVLEALATDGTEQERGARVVYMTRPVVYGSFRGSLLYNGRGRPLTLDEPSLTINASGGNHVHWFDTEAVTRPYWEHLRAGGGPRMGDVAGTRRLTPRQMATLQGFPLEHNFSGPPSVQVKQIGNAVPPALAYNVVGVNAPGALR